MILLHKNGKKVPFQPVQVVFEHFDGMMENDFIVPFIELWALFCPSLTQTHQLGSVFFPTNDENSTKKGTCSIENTFVMQTDVRCIENDRCDYGAE